MEKMRVALVQMEAKLGRVERNIRRMEYFIREASANKADVICFPEMCLQGYSQGNPLLCPENVPGPSSERISEMSRNYDITVLAGLAESSGSERPFITHLVALPGGKLMKYRKTHLGESEKPFFLPGNELPVFSFHKAKFGIAICWDLHFPEVSTILSLKGAEIIFAPHASPAIAGNRREIWLKYLTARAYDNALYLAACNLVGDDGTGHRYSGGAIVIDPKGNIVSESFTGREEMLLADLDPDVINTIRRRESGSMRHSFFLAGRRPELYGELT